MKLLRCHIENFGVLSGFDREFTEGLNVVLQENGFGKSTLAAFLKAMFYGLPKSRVKSLTENERKRYDPWQGGKYGGFLEFEYQGTQYRVTRYFGKKEDSFSLYDLTNRQDSTRFSEKLGEELFQLDVDSFARSAFIPQLSDRAVTATTSIRAKLTNLVEDTNDLNNFDTAMKQLQDYRKGLKLFKGEGGQIAQLRQQCRTLEGSIAEASKNREPLESVCRRIDELKLEKERKNGQKDDLRALLRQANAQKAAYLQQENLRQLQAQLRERQDALTRLDGQYPNGLPTLGELEEQRKNLTRAADAQRRAESPGNTEDTLLTEEERQRLAALRHMFAHGTPKAQELDTWEKLRRDRDVLQRSQEPGALTEREQADYEVLRRRFSEGVPDEARIRETQRQCRQIAELEGMQRTKAEKGTQKAKLPLLLVGLALVLLGAALLMLQLPLPGVLSGVLGVGAFVWAALGGKHKQDAPAEEETRALSELRQQRDAFLSCYYEDVSSPEEKLGTLLADRQRYMDLSRRNADWTERRRMTQLQLQRLQSELEQAFARFFPGKAYEDGFVQKLRSSLGDLDFLLRRIQEEKDRRAAQSARDRQEAQAAIEKARAFLQHYALNEPTAAACIQRAEADIHSRKMLCAELENAQKALDAFLEKNGDVGPVQALPDLDTLENRERQLQQQLDDLEAALQQARQERGGLEKSVEQIPMWEDQLANLEDALQEAEHKCALADRTMALLEQAKDSLANGYVIGIEEGFRKYAETLLPGDLGNVLVDKDLKLRIDTQGAARETESFSAGLSDCIELCMRLSLVDALFGQEQPFLILDDPFVNLDDAHTQRALNMLHQMAKTHQILYLVCNTSRT